MDFHPTNLSSSYLTIICKQSDHALRLVQTHPNKFENSRIIGAKPNVNDNAQVFLLQQVQKAQDGYQIINCQSSFIFEEVDKQIRVKYGRRSNDQLFSIVKVPIESFYQYYWIKTNIKGNSALSMEGFLRVLPFDQNSQSQMFRFQNADSNETLMKTAIISNEHSGKVIDVPRASKKEGEKIIQWVQNKRWNQRWFFEKAGGNVVVIKSLINGFCLDISGQNRKSGGKIIQWQYKNQANQQWIREPCGNGIYRFRSCLIKNESEQDGAQLTTCDNENQSIYWKIYGAYP